jgi:iron(III) transport system substrate-binding protein
MLKTRHTPGSRLFRFAAVVSLVQTLSFSGAHAQDWKATVEAAKTEGSVVIYASLFPDGVQRVTAAFKKAYPNISLQVSRSHDGGIAQKVRQERQMGASGADLFVTTTYDIFDEQIDAKQLKMPVGPSVKAFLKDGMYRGIAPILSSMPIGIIYNVDALKTPPTSYEDLLKPELKGALGLQLAEAGPTVAAFYDYMRTRYPGYWEKLAQQNAKYYLSSVPLAQATASGEVAAGNFSLPALASPLIAKGAPVKFFVDAKEAFGLQFIAGIFEKAPHPAAAQVFLDFLLSPDGQIALNGGNFGMSVLPNLAGTLPQVPIKTTDPKIYTPERIKSIITEWKATFKQ